MKNSYPSLERWILRKSENSDSASTTNDSSNVGTGAASNSQPVNKVLGMPFAYLCC